MKSLCNIDGCQEPVKSDQERTEARHRWRYTTAQWWASYFRGVVTGAGFAVAVTLVVLHV